MLYEQKLVIHELHTIENKDIFKLSPFFNSKNYLYEALASIRANLNAIQMFYTDRGKEFYNRLID